MLRVFNSESVVCDNGKTGLSTVVTCSDRSSSVLLLETMWRTRSMGMLVVGTVLRFNVRKFILNIGDDHLNGAYCRVTVSSFGRTTSVFGLALGSHGHSPWYIGSAQETSNSFNNGAGPSVPRIHRHQSDRGGGRTHQKLT